MRALLTITDLTRMQGERVCLAGYLPDRTCVRPVFPKGILETWLRVPAPWPMRWWRAPQPIRPFIAVEVDLRQHTPDPPHYEDWQINPNYQRLPFAVLAPERRENLLRALDDGAVAAIFQTSIQTGPGWYVQAGTGARSLGTVVPQQVERVRFTTKGEGKWDFRLSFTDSAGERYTLAVTDLAFRHYLVHLATVEGRSPEDCAMALTETLQTTQVYIRIGLAPLGSLS